MIEKADADNDSRVSEEEFYNIMTRKVAPAWLAHSLIRYTLNNKS